MLVPNPLFIRVSLSRDRKRKKFVGPSSEEGQKAKRIKTESGHWIKASYKSDAYQRWREKYKIDTPLGGQEEAAVSNVWPRGRGRKGQKFHRGGETGQGKVGGRYELGGQRGGGRSQRGGRSQTGKKQEVADLKPKQVILQKRRRKELMECKKASQRKKRGEQSFMKPARRKKSK